MATMTKEEAAWIKKLQKVLNECPSKRIAGNVTGDPHMQLFDVTLKDIIEEAEQSQKIEFGEAIDRVGADFTALLFPFQIHATAG
jgi:hypothetical protein